MLKKRSTFGVVILACVLFFTPVQSAYGFSPEGDSRQGNQMCSAWGVQDIKDVLTKLNIPGAKVLNIAGSPLKGFCEVVFEDRGRMGIFYLDVDKKYLIWGSLVELANLSNKTQESIRRIQDRKRIDTAKIPLNEALVLGDGGASRKVIVFTDPDCPYCGQLHLTMKQIVAQRKDIAFYIKFLPLAFHKDAYWKAKSIVCNKSLQMLEDNFEKKNIPKTECATGEIDNSMKLAASLGITATPSLILPDGRLREGAIPARELLDLIDGKK